MDSAGDPPSTRRGCFLVVEGVDGAGKTTQIDALNRWLPGSGLMPAGARLVLTREPGGTALGVRLRELLLHPPADQAPAPSTELLLYAADRAQHVNGLIRPALERGDWVLCDRYTGSTLAYQGWGRGLAIDHIRQLQAIATEGLGADVTLWLDLPLEAALERRGRRSGEPDRMEASGRAFLARVCEGFEALSREHRWQRLDAGASPDRVQEAARAVLRRVLAPASPAADEPVP
ncbi:dTMP kinase [Synechococcus sp. RSCCF101]|uniref:dTMP kinase n=1 Tax=Synechococcus sp. RSCCF101 TaxID=2511069 RepID=UPI001249339E|nr:dTMP kinase [Synechococcus sp. RSCCF101]QEY33527.1 dTMP kinase [Synechococcus sp. RSCCF101]